MLNEWSSSFLSITVVKVKLTREGGFDLRLWAPQVGLKRNLERNSQTVIGLSMPIEKLEKQRRRKQWERENKAEKGKQIYQVSPTSNLLSFIKHNKRFQLIANMARCVVHEDVRNIGSVKVNLLALPTYQLSLNCVMPFTCWAHCKKPFLVPEALHI